MKNFWHSVFIMCIMVFFSYGNEILNVSYSTSGLLLQNGAVIHPDASMITDPTECFDMGTNGNIEIPNIALPQGPFSIESKFYLRGYNESDPNISGILEAFSCDYGNTGAGNTEGVAFRIGGGYLYPLKIQDVYNNINDWTPPDESAKTARAAISKAIGEFSLGVGQHVWKEVYTNHCIETDTWIHMAVTWDGTNMLVYLNGHDATDNCRILGSQLPAFIANVRTVFIGAENAASSLHFNGKIAYVKIYDEALSSGEIWNKYRQSAGSGKCANFIKIESPRCGEVISPDTKINFSVRDSMDNDVTPPGQAFTVYICREPTFSDTSSVRTFQTTAAGCVLRDHFGADYSNVDGLYYFRISAGNTAGLNKRTDDKNLLPESGILPAYLLGSSMKIVPRPVLGSVHKGISNIRQLTNQVIYDVHGRSIGIGTKVSLSTLKYGIYFVKIENRTGQKLLYVK
jgi:hypothetical protein